MDWPCTRDELDAMHDELIRRNGLKEGIIYMQVTRGAADRTFNFPKEKVKPTLIAFTQAMKPRRQPQCGDRRQGHHHARPALGPARHQDGDAAGPRARQAGGL